VGVHLAEARVSVGTEAVLADFFYIIVGIKVLNTMFGF